MVNEEEFRERAEAASEQELQSKVGQTLKLKDVFVSGAMWAMQQLREGVVQHDAPYDAIHGD